MTLLLFLVVLSAVSDALAATPSFAHAKVQCKIDDKDIDEASGLASSQTHPGILYTQNDKGGTNRIFAVDTNTGKTVAELKIANIINSDWEDLAVGNCGSKSCIYIAETGDHGGSGAKNIIYRVVEPDTIQDQTLKVHSKLHFHWDQLDCETVMVAPNEDVYVVSKVSDGRGTLAKLSHTGWATDKIVGVEKSVVLHQTSTKNDPVSGDITPSGKEMLIKYKEHVYYWSVPNGDYLGAVSQAPADLPYTHEVRGESVCWDRQGSGYYTVSEGKHPNIYYFSRTSTIIG